MAQVIVIGTQIASSTIGYDFPSHMKIEQLRTAACKKT
jgi:hypothetical protein